MRRPNGTGTVYKLSGKRRRPWVASAPGKVIVGYYATKKEAYLALDKATRMPIIDTYNVTFAEVYEQWSEKHFKKLADPGVYKWAYSQMPELYNRKFRELRTRDFQPVFDSHSYLSTASLKHLRNLLSQMTNWAIREEVVTTNYVKFVELPPGGHGERKIFSDTEIEKIRQDDSDAARMTLMMIYTGLRIGELYSLTPMAIHGDYLVGGEKTKAGKNRTVPIPRTVKPYFDWFCDELHGEWPWGAPTFRRHYKCMLLRLGIEYKPPHSCRHTFASICRRSGVPPEILQKIMGHSSYTITADIYVHQDREDLIAAVIDL